MRCKASSCKLDHQVLAHASVIGSSHPLYGHAIAADDTAYCFAAADPAPTAGGPPPAWRLMRLAK